MCIRDSHYIGEHKEGIKVIRNDEMSVNQILELEPSKIVISPGPCTPNEAGISVELIQSSKVPILGVCLGHQSIGAAFGGKIIKAPEVFHGKTSSINHDDSLLFKDIESPCEVVRYHSLIVNPENFPVLGELLPPTPPESKGLLTVTSSGIEKV